MYIKGKVRQIIFKSDSGFTVGLFKVIETDNNDHLNNFITFTGTFPDLNISKDYIFYGEITTHYKYGEQFLVSEYEQALPSSKDGLISFLSSKLFRGIGSRLATSIVNKLGDNALEIIVNDYETLLDLKGMTNKKALMIHDILEKEINSYKIIIDLQKLGFTINEASKIYKYYKEASLSIINDNIYTIIDDIDNIGFLTIDKIALNQNINIDDERRIKACIIYIMNELCLENGNVYNEINDIYLGVSNYLNINILFDDYKYFILKLNKENKVIIEDDKYYLKSYYDIEVYISEFLLKLINKEDKDNNIDSYIKELEKEYKITYNEKQKQAIIYSFLKHILVITGGPGTGKTTILKAITSIYLDIDNKDNLILLAPTGRAAKRMNEVTGMTAMTIHKFLKWNKETNDFGVNEYNKSDVTYVIVDEVSMVDQFLFYNLLKGLRDDVRLILVGDSNQLPCVGPGEVLKDLITSEKIPIIKLNDLYRQKENSYIVSLAYEINKGEIPLKYEIKHDDYNFIESNHLNISKYIVSLCEKALEKGYSYKDIQVLIPMYKGINGIDKMNIILQDVFNPVKEDIFYEYGGVRYRIGDKVLQIKNNNEINVSNGDIGTIENIIKASDKTTILIDFNDEIVEYNNKDFEDIRLGYAISIHKAQGSEFDLVILPVDTSYKRMLYRKLLYTGVTRAKKSLMIVGEKEAFKMAVINTREQYRKTTLKDRLKNT